MSIPVESHKLPTLVTSLKEDTDSVDDHLTQEKWKEKGKQIITDSETETNSEIGECFNNISFNHDIYVTLQIQWHWWIIFETGTLFLLAKFANCL